MAQIKSALVLLHPIISKDHQRIAVRHGIGKGFWSGKSLAFCTSLNSGPNKISGGCGVTGVSSACTDSAAKHKKIQAGINAIFAGEKVRGFHQSFSFGETE
ncbi:hypothetical protein SE959_15510 [Escherichia coli]|nr:hypothetical protein [Escherichia coli]